MMADSLGREEEAVGGRCAPPRIQQEPKRDPNEVEELLINNDINQNDVDRSLFIQKRCLVGA